jgi:hypothetical protein
MVSFIQKCHQQALIILFHTTGKNTFAKEITDQQGSKYSL